MDKEQEKGIVMKPALTLSKRLKSSYCSRGRLSVNPQTVQQPADYHCMH